MKIAVAGLWHLGSVTAACLAGANHEVTGYDEPGPVLEGLRAGRPPVAEPGLAEALAAGLAAGRLRFTSEPRDLAAAELVWITWDTPVDEDDRADAEFVLSRVRVLFPFLSAGTLVLVSSQLPAGSTRALEADYRAAHPNGGASFAYAPENLRLGRALEAFTRAERVVAGVRTERDRERLAELFRPFAARIEWMSVESAEMTKHALNAFLATSVAFINEVAALCERTGADAREVERGLKSDPRVGPRAYVKPGAAFAGGTLARDLAYLSALGAAGGLPTPLLDGVRAGNRAHLAWPQRRLAEVLGEPRGARVAILGLAYKPGTDTLRRSSAVETCRWLAARGATVAACDPAVRELPAELRDVLALVSSPEEALRGARAALVATEWPAFRSLTADQVAAWMERPVVLDPGAFLEDRLGGDARIRYLRVGRGA